MSLQWIAKRECDVGKFFGVSTSSVREWKKNGMPWKPSSYSLSGIYAWLKDREAKNLDRQRGKSSHSALRNARLRLLQLKIDRETGALVPRSEFNSYVLRAFTAFKNGLLALAPTLSSRSAVADERARLAAIEDALFGFLRSLIDLYGQGANATEEDPSAGASERRPPRRRSAKRRR